MVAVDRFGDFRKCVAQARKQHGLPTDLFVKAGAGKAPRPFIKSALAIAVGLREVRGLLLRKARAARNQSMSINVYSTESAAEGALEQVETECADFIQTCRASVLDLKKTASLQVTGQLQQHQTAVIESLQLTLQELSATLREVQTERLAKSSARRQLMGLGTHPTPKSATATSSGSSVSERRNVRVQRNTSIISSGARSPIVVSPASSVYEDAGDDVDDESASITGEERQLMEEENEALYSELNETLDEVKKAEKSVREIVKLNQLFTENVVLQSEKINEIHAYAEETTSHVVNANAELQEALEHGSSFRKYVLIFLLVASGIVLFLDWLTPV